MSVVWQIWIIQVILSPGEIIATMWMTILEKELIEQWVIWNDDLCSLLLK
jgi:hypothetical protein